MVTAAQIKKFAPTAKPALVTAIVDNWSDAVAAGIVTDLRLQHFFSEIATETGGLRSVEESLNYTSAQRIYDVFKGPAKAPRFKSVAECKPYVRQPQKLAIKVYGGRLGNAAAPSTDGWDYRGGGMMQTTGRSNYRDMGFENNPEALRDPVTAFKTAVREWSKRGCNAMADRDDVVAVRKAINGGTNGLAETREYLKKAKAVFKTGATGTAPKPVSKPVSAPVDLPAPTSTSKQNDRLIEQVQDLLWDKGYPEVGESDNKFGRRTRNAIMAFQADNDLPVTGEITDDLLSQLVKAPAREMSDARKTATKEDLKTEEPVKTGGLLQKIGMGTILTSLVGGGVTSLDDLNGKLTSAQAVYNTLSSFAPWLIGVAVGGVVIFIGSRVIKHFVVAYREGRAF